jgi:hypothetical protein
VLNPKTALYFFAFLPELVEPARGAAPLLFLIFGTLSAALGVCSDSLYGARWLPHRTGERIREPGPGPARVLPAPAAWREGCQPPPPGARRATVPERRWR